VVHQAQAEEYVAKNDIKLVNIEYLAHEAFSGRGGLEKLSC